MQKGIMILAVLLALMCLPFQNCAPSGSSSSGTETGNALAPPAPESGNSGTVVAPGAAVASAALVTAFCNRVEACYPTFTTNQCQSEYGLIVLTPANPEACQTALQSLACVNLAAQAVVTNSTSSTVVPLLMQILGCGP